MGVCYGAADGFVSIQLLLAIRSRFTRRARLEAENLILRQQLVVLRRKSPTRVRLWNIDRLVLVMVDDRRQHRCRLKPRRKTLENGVVKPIWKCRNECLMGRSSNSTG